jgi:hypothetical protein
MDKYLAIIIRAIAQHGQTCTYTVVTEGVYDVETSSTVNTETNYSIKMYKKHLRTNQFNFPSLVGRDAALFHLANNSLSFKPAVKDKITVDTIVYTVDSITEHSADGLVILYKILTVKG